MHPLKLCALTSLALTAGWLDASVTALRAAHGDTAISFEEAMAVLAEAATGAGKFIVYEGLPHSFEGKEFVETEIRTKPTTMFDENWFYLPSQAVAAGDRASLQRLFNGGLFKPWRGFKFCGGFHADYAVGFDFAGSAYRVLICFGCHEARILRVDGEDSEHRTVKKLRLTTDLTDAGYKELRELFKKYRKQRPPPPDRKAQVTKPPGPPKVPVRL